MRRLLLPLFFTACFEFKNDFAVDNDNDGYSEYDGDCDDFEPDINPSTSELCDDDIDNNCDGAIDDNTAIDAQIWYNDKDGDSYGDPTDFLLSCTSPQGQFTSENTDCDDSSPYLGSSTNDQDCDGIKRDVDCDDNDPNTIYDMDCDSVPVSVDCNDQSTALGDIANDQDCDGWLTAADCDDNDKFTYPGVAYIDSSIDCMKDFDGDGFGDLFASGQIIQGTDCDDTDNLVNPISFDLPLEERSCDGFIDTPASLALANYTFIGENSYDRSGSSVSSAGDVDGDGLDDLIIGAPFNDDGGEDNGKVYLFLGSSLASNYTIDISQADYAFIGESQSDYPGNSLSSAGDVDGDGLEDIIIAAYKNNDGGLDAGKTYLILGASLGSNPTIDLAQADYEFIGENQGDYSGSSVSNAGDIDGDGLSDLLIGASGANANDDGGVRAGKTYLILGASLGSSSTIDLSQADYIFIGESGSDSLGHSVSNAGDIDGDGLDDILIGAPHNDEGGGDAGQTYLFLGSSLGPNGGLYLSQADYVFTGENQGDASGYSVSNAGDVDGDGLSDLLIGAYDNDDGGVGAGKTYLIFGASLGSTATIDLSQADYVFIGESGGDHSGWSVSNAGDVDGDGLDDIIIGSISGGVTNGQSYLVLGSSLVQSASIDLTQADFSFIGENQGDASGYSVSNAGDVNGDGLDDIIIGALYNDDGGTSSGKAYLILSGL